jgi:FkbM family methyltransferase
MKSHSGRPGAFRVSPLQAYGARMSGLAAGSGLKELVRQTKLFPHAKAAQEWLSPGRRRSRRNRMAFYRDFVRPGELAFDVGANIGNRSEVFLALGARVVAVDPQPLCATTLAKRFGRHRNFTLLRTGLAREAGTATLHLASSHVLASMSTEFINRSRYKGNAWAGHQQVRVTTLDSMVAVFGIPDFCKIDVEGFEYEVLQGLSSAIPALSFEFNPAMRDMTVRCLDHLDSMANYLYAFSPGETMRPADDWFDHDRAVSMALDPDLPWGDFYARTVIRV